MKNIKKLFVVFLGVLLFFTIGNFTANAATSIHCFRIYGEGKIIDYYDYKYNDPSKEKCPRDVDIPSKVVKGKAFGYVTRKANITGIASKAFYGKGITSVDLPEYIDYIGRSAFANNKIENIVFHNKKDLNIGDYAFKNNKIQTLTLPSSVISIGREAFSQNEIKTLKEGYGLRFIGDYAFKKNEIQDLTIPGNVVEIGDYAFIENKIKTLKLSKVGHKKLKKIGKSAFEGNQIQNLTLGNNLEEIGNSAFYKNQIKTLTLGDSIKEIGDNAFNENKIETLKLGKNLEIIGKFAFWSNKIKTVIIPDSVKTIGEDAFAGNQIYSLKLGNNLKSIGEYAFSFSEIKELKIPDSVETIGKGAFYESKIKNLTLGSGVKEIGEKAFDLNNIEKLTLGNAIKTIGDSAFFKNKIKELKIPDSVEKIGEHAFYSNNIEKLTLGNNLKKIGNYVFAGNKIKELKIPDSVETIGEYAFYKNEIQNLTLGKSIKTIGKYAFSVNKLSKLLLPNSLTNVGLGAFGYNKTKPVIGIVNWDPNNPSNIKRKEDIEGTRKDKDLSFLKLEKFECFSFNKQTKTISGYNEFACGKDVVIPAQIDGVNVEKIGYAAFNLKGITSVVIPNTVKEIKNQAFWSNKIKTVIIPDSVEIIGDEAFLKNEISVLKLGKNLKTIGKEAFKNNKIWKLIIPKNLEIIGKSAFAYNNIQTLSMWSADKLRIIGSSAFSFNKIKEVRIPDSVEEIHDRAFGSQVAKLSFEVFSGSKIKLIGEKAFYGSKIKNLTIPDSVETIGILAFGNNQIENLVLGNKLKTIKYNAFEGNKLKKVVLPDGLESVFGDAFKNNTANPVIGAVSWDPDASSNKKRKEKIEGTKKEPSYLKLKKEAVSNVCFKFDATKKRIDKYYNNEGDIKTNPACPKTVVIPAQIKGVNVEEIGDHAFNSKNIYSVSFPNTIKIIGSSSFAGNQIKNLTLPDSLEEVQAYAFNYSQIENLTLPRNIKIIGVASFKRNKIRNLTIPNSVEIIKDGAFQENKIKNLTLGNNLKKIGFSAFNTNELTKVKLPNSLESVGFGAFKNNKTNPVIGEVSWDPASNKTKREAIEGTSKSKTYLKLKKVGASTLKQLSIKFELNGGVAPKSDPYVFDDKQTSKGYSYGDSIPANEFSFFKNKIPTKAGYTFKGWYFKIFKENGNLTSNSEDIKTYWDFKFSFLFGKDNAKVVFVADWQKAIGNKPIITLKGKNPQILRVGDKYKEFGAEAQDKEDGNITKNIKIDSSLVNTSKVGNYNVFYKITDKDSNLVSKIRVVTVIPKKGVKRGGGGGGGESTEIDKCPDGDFSPSPFDGRCEKTKEETIVETENKEEIMKEENPEINREREYKLNDRTCPLMENILSDNYMPNFRSSFKDISNLDVETIKGIVKLEKSGVVKGRKPGVFAPKGNITRAEFLAIALFSHCYNVYEPATKLPFRDMQDLSDWKARVVQVGYNNGIIGGYSDNTFRPNDNISKIEAYAIMMKLREIELVDKNKENSLKTSYTDKAASWQEKPLALGEYLGILNPAETNNKFNPNKKLTREEMVKIMMKIMEIY